MLCVYALQPVSRKYVRVMESIKMRDLVANHIEVKDANNGHDPRYW